VTTARPETNNQPTVGIYVVLSGACRLGGPVVWSISARSLGFGNDAALSLRYGTATTRGARMVMIVMISSCWARQHMLGQAHWRRCIIFVWNEHKMLEYDYLTKLPQWQCSKRLMSFYLIRLRTEWKPTRRKPDIEFNGLELQPFWSQPRYSSLVNAASICLARRADAFETTKGIAWISDFLANNLLTSCTSPQFRYWLCLVCWCWSSLPYPNCYWPKAGNSLPTSAQVRCSASQIQLEASSVWRCGF